MSKKKIHLYPDRPETSSDLKFAHRVLGTWLEDILRDIVTPYRIAITSKLGSGKSTVVQKALQYFEENEEKYASAYVDVWKLDKESSRRSAILRIAEEFEINEDTYKKIESDIYGRSTDFSNANIKDFFKGKAGDLTKEQIAFVLLLSLSLGVITYLSLESLDFTKEMHDGLKFLAGLGVTVYTAMLNFVSRYILQVKSTMARDPFVGPEEFESSLEEILKDKNVAGKRAIIVFDNIDRAPKSRTEEILTGISAFFDNSKHKSLRDLVILVPFSEHEHDELDEKTIQKFFDAAIPLPELVPDDLIEYSKEKLVDSEWKQEAEQIAELIDFGPFHTPRQILHFINELVARDNLAERLESERHITEEGNYESYLPKGAITKNRVFFAKSSICEKIWPGFLNFVVSHFHEPKEIFEVTQAEIILEKAKNTLPSDKQKIHLLLKFLKQTEGTPSSLPESFEAVLYFKGSDTEVSIPGGFTVRNALVRRDSEKIKEFIDDDPDKNVGNLLKLFKIILKRNKGNYLRVRNSFSTICQTLEVDQFTPEAKAILNEAVIGNPKIIEDVPLKYIVSITELNDTEVANIKTWKFVDEHYKSLLKMEESERKEGFKNWEADYLKEVFRQPKGIERAQLDPSKVPTSVLMENESRQSFDGTYPHEIVTPGHALEAIEYAINTEFEDLEGVEFSNIPALVERAFHLCGDGHAEITKTIFEKIWTKLNELFSKKDYDPKKIDGIVRILISLPSDSRCPAEKWTPLKQNLNGHHGHVKQAIDKSARKEAFGLLVVLLDKVNIADQPNLINNLKEAVNNSQVEDYQYLFSILEEWSWVEAVAKTIKAEFTKRLKQKNILSFFIKNSENSAANYLLDNWKDFAGLPFISEIILELPEEDEFKVSQKDLVTLVSNEPGLVAGETRVATLRLLATHDLADSADKIIEAQIPERTNVKVIKDLCEWIIKNKREKIEELMSSAKQEIEQSNVNPWTAKEVCTMILATIDPSGRTDDYFYDITDKAINRGISSCNDQVVVIEVADSLVKIWNAGVKPAEKHLDAFETAVKSKDFFEDEKSLPESINKIRKKYDIKKSTLKKGLEKLGLD